MVLMMKRMDTIFTPTASPSNNLQITVCQSDYWENAVNKPTATANMQWKDVAFINNSLIHIHCELCGTPCLFIYYLWQTLLTKATRESNH